MVCCMRHRLQKMEHTHRNYNSTLARERLNEKLLFRFHDFTSIKIPCLLFWGWFRRFNVVVYGVVESIFWRAVQAKVYASTMMTMMILFVHFYRNQHSNNQRPMPLLIWSSMMLSRMFRSEGHTVNEISLPFISTRCSWVETILWLWDLNSDRQHLYAVPNLLKRSSKVTY